MSSRKPIPDIMGDLMSGGTAVIEAKPVSKPELKQSSNKDIEKESGKAIKLHKNKEICQAGVKEIVEEMKEKATFNLSLSTLEALEDAWIKLKRQLKGEQRITKTLIVERAIEMALDELKTKGKESEIVRRLTDS